MTVGIYRIYNKVTGRSYVGQSKNIENRIKRHFSQIRSKFPIGAAYKRMKEDYEKYGMESFAYEVLEECSPDDLDDREGYWAYQFKVFDPVKGYNIARWQMKSYDKYIPPEEKQRIKEENRLNSYLDFAQENNKNPEDPRTFYEYIGRVQPTFYPIGFGDPRNPTKKRIEPSAG